MFSTSPQRFSRGLHNPPTPTNNNTTLSPDSATNSPSKKSSGQLAQGTVAVPVIYLCSSDATGLHALIHFYRVLVPDLKVSLGLTSAPNDANQHQQQQQQQQQPGGTISPTTTTPTTAVSDDSLGSAAFPKDPRKSFPAAASKIIEDGSCPIVYVVPRSAVDSIVSSSALAASVPGAPDVAVPAGTPLGGVAAGGTSVGGAANSSSSVLLGGASSSSSASRGGGVANAREMILQTIEFARVQFLVMPSTDAQKLLDEAGCVPPKYWSDVSLASLCASADFPVASTTAASPVGRVFFDSNFGGENTAGAGAAEAVSRVAVVVSLTRARRVIHIMNDHVVPSESTAISRQLRALSATLWHMLCVKASEDALEFVRPVISGSATVRAAHASRLIHIRRVKKLRESLFTVDATAGAVFQSELTESRRLTQAATSIKQQVYRSIGIFSDLVGSSMRHDVDWSSVERPPYGRELRRTHFRPYHHHHHHHQSRPPGSAAASAKEEEQVFLWSKALTPIQVRLSRQGWERLVQSDPVMWRFKSLPVRLKETTTKLSKLFSCSTAELMISESTQIARATVLRSLPWTPGDVLLLMDGLVPGVYTALASFLKEHHGVVIHTLATTEPLPKASSATIAAAAAAANTANPAADSAECGDEPIVAALARAIDLVRPLVCIIPHVTRTGFVLPVERLIPVCRSRRVVVIVDGTDVINNVATQVGHYGADFYIAPLDTHLFCPAGLTATVVSKTRKEAVSTLVHSYFYGQGFDEEWTYTGLTDQTRMISIIQALQFNKNVCPGAAQYSKQLAEKAHELLTKFWNVEPIYKEFESAIIAVMLPLAGQRHDADARFLQALLVRRGIFVDILAVRFARGNSKLVARLQFYPYNDILEVKRLAIEMVDALREIV